ncbi:MAG TPA: DUF6644 family protein [Terriglobia bacterium]|nr:DUF6644 family protein [Terriglobia bacterium]
MDFAAFLKTLESTSLAGWIRDSLYAFPFIESFHVIGLTLVFGTIAIVDLRLLGIASTYRPFTRVAEILKWTWAAFGLTILTGSLMFITNASVYFSNVQFRWKILLIALSGLNMVVFELTSGRNVRRWDNDRSAPPLGKLAAVLSIALWITVIFLGRWVGFTTTGKSAAPTPDIEINLDDLFK